MSQISTLTNIDAIEKENVAEKMEKFSLKVVIEKLNNSSIFHECHLNSRFGGATVVSSLAISVSIILRDFFLMFLLHKIIKMQTPIKWCTFNQLFLIAIQSPRKVLTENDKNVLPTKQPKLKGMDDVCQPEQKPETEINGDESTMVNVVGAIAHKKSAYPFDPSKEPLLRDNPRRFVVFPIEYHDIWQMYKKVSYLVIDNICMSELI